MKFNPVELSLFLSAALTYTKSEFVFYDGKIAVTDGQTLAYLQSSKTKGDGAVHAIARKDVINLLKAINPQAGAGDMVIVIEYGMLSAHGAGLVSPFMCMAGPGDARLLKLQDGEGLHSAPFRYSHVVLALRFLPEGAQVVFSRASAVAPLHLRGNNVGFLTVGLRSDATC